MRGKAHRVRCAEPGPDGPALGTRARALPAMGAGFLCLAVLHALVSSGVLAVNFTTADRQFQVYSNYIQGVYGAGYLARNDGYSVTSQVGVAEIGFKTAKLSGFCAIAHEDVPGLGPMSFMILAGVPVRSSFTDGALVSADGAGNPITIDSSGSLTGQSDTDAISITDMYLNTTSLRGYGNKIAGLNLGQDAATTGASAGLAFPNDQGGSGPQSGRFGLYSHFLNVSGLDGSSYGVDLVGQVTLPKMKIKVLPGDKTQADCPTEAMP